MMMIVMLYNSARMVCPYTEDIEYIDYEVYKYKQGNVHIETTISYTTNYWIVVNGVMYYIL